jgi:hypothetical protein
MAILLKNLSYNGSINSSSGFESPYFQVDGYDHISLTMDSSHNATLRITYSYDGIAGALTETIITSATSGFNNVLPKTRFLKVLFKAINCVKMI